MNAPFPFRAPAAVRTLLTTEHPYDAGVCGFDGPTPPGVDGGFAVTFDGRDVPTVIINGSDGEVSICGAGAIEALANALLQAESLANRKQAVREKEVSLSQDSLIRMGAGGE